MQAVHRVTLNTGILYARMAITVCISLYATRVILAALGAEDFGIFNVVGGAISMLTFLNTSMAAATQRFMSFAHGQGDEVEQRRIFNVSLVLHSIIAILVLGALEVAGFVLFHGVLKIAPDRMNVAWLIYQFTVISTLFTIVAVPYEAVINARENMLFFAILGVIEAVLKLGIALLVRGISFDKLTGYGFLMAILSIILLLIRVAFCHNRYQECVFAPRQNFDKKLSREMTAFAGWSFLGASSSMLANYGQGIILNMFFGSVVNAAQGIAGQVSGQLGVFAVTMLKALNPLIAKSEGAGDRDLMIKASNIGSKVSFALLIFCYVPILIEMPYLFNLWLVDVPDYAVLFCRLLLARNLIEQMYITLNSAIAAVGKIRFFQVGISLLNILPLLLSYLLFRMNSSPVSLYLSYMVYSLLALIFTIAISKAKYNLDIIDYLINVVSRCFLAFFLCVVISALPTLLLPVGLLRFFCISIISLVCFVITTYCLILTKNERNSSRIIILEIKTKLVRVSNQYFHNHFMK